MTYYTTILMFSIIYSCLFSRYDPCIAPVNGLVVYERGAWLRLYGVLLHVWNIHFLTLISSTYKRLLKVDSCTSNIERLQFARILITTNSFETINVMEELLVDDKTCKIKIVEELEYGLPRDACIEDEGTDGDSVYSELNCEHNNEPIIYTLVQELK